MYRKEDGTYVFPQISKNAARAKWGRMLSGAGFFGMKHFTIGFANWSLNMDNNSIECYTTYHSDFTVYEMYRTNCKSF